MNMYAAKAAAIVLTMILVPVSAQAAEVTLVISNAFMAPMEDLAPRFEKASGHKLVTSYGSTNPLKVRIEKGEIFDLTPNYLSVLMFYSFGEYLR